MIYAYIRISTDKQIKENQKFEIEKFAKEKGLTIDSWVSEQVTGTKAAKDRRLGPLLKKMRKGDTLVISEISRLGRNLMNIMSMLNLCMKNMYMHICHPIIIIFVVNWTSYLLEN